MHTAPVWHASAEEDASSRSTYTPCGRRSSAPGSSSSFIDAVWERAMSSPRVAGAAFWMMLSSVAVMGQTLTAQIGPGPNAPGESRFTRTYPSSGVMPTRRLQIRSESDGREVVTEIVETPDIDGRFKPSLETTSETVRPAANAVQITREVFGFGVSGRLLMER